MEKKLRVYVDRKFFAYPKTEQIVELREELFSMMRDKYNDCMKSGLSEEESYKKSITIMDDYKSAIREIETGSSLGALKKKLVSSFSFSTFYFIAITCIYLFVSMIVLKSFENTWLIIVGGAFLYAIYITSTILGYAKMFNMKILSRWSLGALFLSFIPLLYVFPTLFLEEIYSKNTWDHSWLLIMAILFTYVVTDFIVYGKQMPKLFSILELTFAGLIFTTIIYLYSSFMFGLWRFTWLIYVLYLCIVSLAFYITEKTKPKS